MWKRGMPQALLLNCKGERYACGSNRSLVMTFGMGMRAETHGGCSTMNAGTRQTLQVAEQAEKKIHSNGNRPRNIVAGETAARVNGG